MFDAYTEAKSDVFSPARHAFTRRGSYFGLVARPMRHTMAKDVGKWGTTDLYVATGRGGAAALDSVLNMQLIPVHHGTIIPFALHTTPTELEILTGYGTITCCFAEPSLLLIRGTNGLGLLTETDMGLHRTIRGRGENSWEACQTPAASFVYTAVHGAYRMKADWDYERLCTPQVRGEVVPDADGTFLLAVEEFSHCGCRRSSYPSYDEGLADANADWNAYLDRMPAIPAYASARESAAYLTWSLLAEPCCRAGHPLMFRSLGHAADGRQICESAAAVSGDPALAVDLLLGQLDQQSPEGQIPVFCDDTKGLFQTVSLPAQGWALEYLMSRFDLAQTVSPEKLTALYEGYGKWVRWYDAYRDDDGDGIPQYEGGEECGAPGSPVFADCCAAELPDLCAFLALLEEKLGDLAGMIGRGAESAAWYERSRTRIDRMLRTFWNGSRFVGHVHGTGAPLETEALLLYRPLILGKRLPPEVLETMTEDLSEGNGFLTPGGLTAVRMTDRDFSPLSADTGRIAPGDNLLIALGLLRAGKEREARELARRFCDGVTKPVSAAYPVDRGFADSRTAAVFQLLAELACGEEA